MKKNALYAVMVLVSFVFVACGNNSAKTEQMTDKASEFSVTLGRIKEVSKSDSAASDNQTLSSVRVFSCLNDGKCTKYTPYAYGLFDIATELPIKLQEGYKYRFECATIKDRSMVSDSTGLNTFSYYTAIAGSDENYYNMEYQSSYTFDVLYKSTEKDNSVTVSYEDPGFDVEPRVTLKNANS